MVHRAFTLLGCTHALLLATASTDLPDANGRTALQHGEAQGRKATTTLQAEAKGHPAVAELIRRHAAPHATVPYFPLTHELDVTCLVLFLRGAPRPPRARPLLSFRVPLRLRSSASHLRTLFAL